jgi:hypothetical protein
MGESENTTPAKVANTARAELWEAAMKYHTDPYRIPFAGTGFAIVIAILALLIVIAMLLMVSITPA